ncbi:NAD(P)H-dependent glycerol-3-phosphate dehydrogenase [Spiribacter halobius]|uniref:Glycerol-3-phosphate dehydrogenase [NAD(P)+] n=1 Tax=Sediminicurvatus halobius TaxID=2182432 RepID=A0A2U2N2V9_9GAMM|nr:NAD(P)H-dependent glycerol-3-phosphate dehydrogenase [Spiribacter halobius]PWG63430.1 glycerol-3-phosphate dehydrogenase [Spiribacter halobius]UEX78101.1 NAD(P)-dependent glycerol-3-phosphate dehydrogenase [Spiribacter halobius]
MQRFAVLGAGSWGTALALVLARNGHTVRLWGHDRERMAALARERRNTRYLPDAALPDQVAPTADLDAALVDAEAVLVVVPSVAFGEVLAAVASRLPPGVGLAWATKGLDADSGGLLHQLARRHLPTTPLAVLSGPSFAAEVARGLPTAVSLAATEADWAERLAAAFHDERFRVYTSTDVIGVELGGAVKNVLAIATGIADGLGFGANARAGLITRGLAEVRRLGRALGAEDHTLTGLAGMGDLILTCTDDQSRNRRLGLALGRGESLDGAVAAIGQVVEGVRTAGELHRLAADCGVELPIAHQVHRVVAEGLAPHEAARNLMQRAARAEFE